MSRSDERPGPATYPSASRANQRSGAIPGPQRGSSGDNEVDFGGVWLRTYAPLPGRGDVMARPWGPARGHACKNRSQ